VPGAATHKLLVSVPDLGDPNFDQAVIYVVDHGPDGALGLVVNQPGPTAIETHLPHLGIPVLEPQVFFNGGPVAPGAVLSLGRRTAGAELTGAVVMSGPVVLVDIEYLVDGNVEGVDGLRLYAGYSGWSPGQLDAEIDAGVWYVIDAGPDDVLCARPEDLWRSVLRRQGGTIGAVGLYPADPTQN